MHIDALNTEAINVASSNPMVSLIPYPNPNLIYPFPNLNAYLNLNPVLTPHLNPDPFKCSLWTASALDRASLLIALTSDLYYSHTPLGARFWTEDQEGLVPLHA